MSVFADSIVQQCKILSWQRATYKMKNTIVQKLLIGLVALCALDGMMSFSGCVHEKTGSGGHIQPYDASS